MKYLLILLFSIGAWGQECPKVGGCDRIVSLKKGQSKEYSHTTHVVVKRASKCDLELAKAKQKIAELEAKVAALESSNALLANRKPVVIPGPVKIVKTVVNKSDKHIISALLGRGYTSAKMKVIPGVSSLELERDNIFGFQYQAKVGKNVYLGGFGLNNQSYGLSLGFGF